MAASQIIFNVCGNGTTAFPGLKALPSGTESTSGTSIHAASSHPVVFDNGNFAALSVNTGYYYAINASDLSLVADVAAIDGSLNGNTCLATDGTSLFILTKHSIGGGNYEWKLRKWSQAGVLLQTWDLTSIIPEATDTTLDIGSPMKLWNFPASIAISRDGGTLYLAITTGSAQNRATTIRVIDLAGLTNNAFVTAGAGDVKSTIQNGLLVMQDGSILAAWTGSGGTSRVARYDASGTELSSFPLPNNFNNVVRMQLGPDETTFWAGVYDPVMSNGYDFIEFDIATEAALQTVTTDLNGWPAVSFDQDVEPDLGYVVVFAATPTAAGLPLPTPSAPQIQCTPQSTVGNGGKGNAGCNTGGVGWVRSYTGPWGSVPDHPDPADGETLTGSNGRGVEVWIELVHTAYPSGTKTTYRRAMVPLADPPTYHGGYKSDGVLAIGDIEHGAGNEQDGFEAATVTAQYADETDRLFRDMLDDQDLEGDELRVKIATDRARVTAVEPRVLARGVVQGPELSSMRRASIEAVDALFADTGPLGPNALFPLRTYGDLGSGAPQMTADTKATPIPPPYGELSDAGATDPLTGAVNPKGKVPGVYLGKFRVTGLPTPSPSSGTTLAQVVANLQASVNAGTTDADWGAIIGSQDAADLEALGTVPNTYNMLAAVIGYADLDALLAMGTTPAPTSDEWGIIAFGYGPVYAFLQLFGSDLGNGDPQAKHDRVELDIVARSGSDILVPGFSPCPWTAFTIINDDGEQFDLACIGVRGPLLDDHVNGVVNITANLIGLEEVGDGSGLPLGLAYDVKQHWIENFLLERKTCGPWVTNSTAPKWEDGVYKVRSSTFRERQAFTATALGGDGLLVSWYPDKQRAVTEHLGTWTASLESRTGTNQHFQVIEWGLDETLDTATWPRIEHSVDLFGPMRVRFGQLRENVVNGVCDYDPDTEQYRIGPLSPPLRDPAAITKYKGRQKPGPVLENPLLTDETSLRWVLQRRLSRLASGMTLVEVVGPEEWLDYDIGTGLLLTSDDGRGVGGYVDAPMIVLRRRYSFDQRTVTFTFWDVRDVLLATRFPNGLSRQVLVTDTTGAAPVVTDDANTAPLVLT